MLQIWSGSKLLFVSDFLLDIQDYLMLFELMVHKAHIKIEINGKIVLISFTFSFLSRIK